jgi:hypothetical protein
MSVVRPPFVAVTVLAAAAIVVPIVVPTPPAPSVAPVPRELELPVTDTDVPIAPRAPLTRAGSCSVLRHQAAMREARMGSFGGSRVGTPADDVAVLYEARELGCLDDFPGLATKVYSFLTARHDETRVDVPNAWSVLARREEAVDACAQLDPSPGSATLSIAVTADGTRTDATGTSPWTVECLETVASSLQLGGAGASTIWVQYDAGGVRVVSDRVHEVEELAKLAGQR